MSDTMRVAGDDAKEAIRARIGIADLVERYVKLKATGQNLKGLCPFHKEKTPSFIVTPSRGTFHCFGCGKGGDIFTFLQEIEGVDFRESLTMLAEEAGVRLPNLRSEPASPERGPNFPPKTEMLRIHTLAMRYYYGQIKQHPQAVEYFKSRGLKAETVREFMLGFAPPGWNNLTDFLAAKGVDPVTLVACGLALQKEGGRPYDRFRDRIMFTLYDAAGRPIAFAGRGLASDSQPKYLNSPETPIYHKSRTLYGLHKALPFVKELDQVLIVEGYMDYLALREAGIGNVVATSGTALTSDHAQMLRRYASKIVLVFDGDAAGIQAALRGVPILAPVNVEVRVLILPGEHDPDSFVRESGAEAFRELLAGAQDGFSFLIDHAVRQHGCGTAHAKSAVLDTLMPTLGAVSDTIVRADYLKRTAESLGVPEQLIAERLPSQRRDRGSERQPAAVLQERPYATRLEGHFMHLLITHPELIREAAEYVHPGTLTDSFDNQLYSTVLKAFERDQTLGSLLDAAGDTEAKRVFASLMSLPDHTQQPDEELAHLVVELQKKFVRHRLRQITLELRKRPHDRDLLREQKDFSLKLKDLTTGQA